MDLSLRRYKQFIGWIHTHIHIYTVVFYLKEKNNHNFSLLLLICNDQHHWYQRCDAFQSSISKLNDFIFASFTLPGTRKLIFSVSAHARPQHELSRPLGFLNTSARVWLAGLLGMCPSSGPLTGQRAPRGLQGDEKCQEGYVRKERTAV